MIGLRAGIIRKVYDCKLVYRDILDIISFTKGYYENITEYNLLHDIIVELDTQSENDISYDLITESFPINKRYFLNHLSNKVALLDGEVKPLARWDKIIKVKMDIMLEPMSKMIVMSDKGNEFYRTDAEINKYYHKALNEYASEDIPTVTERFMGMDIDNECTHDELMSYINESIEKEQKINNTISLVADKLNKIRQTKKCSTLHGVNMSRPRWRKNTTGHANEATVIEILESIGYIIDRCEAMYRTIHDQVIIAGTPDGYIRKSPNDAHNDVYVEIKSKPYSKINRGDAAQIYCYYIITGKPVLLVNFHNNVLECRLYTCQEMQLGWNCIYDQMIINAKRLASILNIDSYDKYMRFKEIMTVDGMNKRIKF
jgi:hypothetical protein